MEGEWQGNVEEEEEVEIDTLRPQSGYVVLHHVAYQEMSMVVMFLITSPATEPRVSRGSNFGLEDPPHCSGSSLKVQVWVKSDPPTLFGGGIYISTPQPLNVEKWINDS